MGNWFFSTPDPDDEQTGVPLIIIGETGLECTVAGEGGDLGEVIIPDLSHNPQGIPCDEHGWPTPEGLAAWHAEYNPNS